MILAFWYRSSATAAIHGSASAAEHGPLEIFINHFSLKHLFCQLLTFVKPN